MKFFKKIGVGIISLGLISTFYIPEAKAGNLTLVEFTVPSSVPTTGGRKYAIKLVTKLYTSGNKQMGKVLIKRVGSGNTDCKTWISTPSQLASFTTCVAAKIGTDMMSSSIYDVIKSDLGF
tara:strand:+ start:83 stop:445 length:363 start_codon:yes stop_codon:yes gene_type:complete